MTLVLFGCLKKKKDRREDKVLGEKDRPKTKNELKEEILKNDPTKSVRGNSKQVQSIALAMGIDLKVSVPKIKEGWVGKSKGMKQVLYERGFLDLANIHLYSKDGPKDENNKTIDDDFSLKHLMAGCTDFVEEETLLQQKARQVGENLGVSVVVDRTPKGHPELAGEGIEYTWANSKIFLRRVPIGKRKTVDQFHKQVKLALSTSKGANLNKNKICKFAARARDFIAAYHLLSPPTSYPQEDQVHQAPQKLTMSDIEKGRKKYRSHRGVERSDTKWCVAVALATMKSAQCEK